MKAIVWTKYGAAEFLEMKELDKPVPKDNEIFVKIMATSVNAGDCEMRGLKFPLLFKIFMRIYFGLTKPRNIILGQELSGIVETVGKDVKLFKVGDKIFASNGMSLGGYAEYKCFPEVPKTGCITQMPENITFEEAAGACIGGLEAVHYLNKFKIKPGDDIIVNGAGGSIGTSVVQIAKQYGAKVTAVDNPMKFEMLKSLGADRVIDYTKEDFTKEINKYDVIFDVVGKSPFVSSLKSLNVNGNYIIANPKGYQKILGWWVRKLTDKQVYFDTSNHEVKNLLFIKDLLASGKMKTYIDSIMSLEEVVQAHKYVESGQKLGNLIIRVSNDQ